jgi:hypothetical protein
MDGFAIWHVLLMVFYAGAVFASARAWLGVWRGHVSFSELRDVTGIGDPVALRRRFGLTAADGRYPVTFAEVVRHRRASGMILTNLPVHVMFALALLWAMTHPAGPSASAIAFAASAHALALAVIAASVLISGREALTD